MARLESLELIDWTAAADLRMRLLRQLHRDFIERASPLRHDLAEFRREAGEALLHHCRFETLQAHLGAGPDWRRWPEPLRRPANRRWPRSAPITPRKWTSAPSASG